MVLNIRLVNIARVVAGLQVSDLYIDFAKLKNPFYLFIGVNGSGKTSILHCIHPFAYNNAVGDSTVNSEFIVDGQDGMKSITYRVDSDIYEIVHNYTRNDNSISVKSFISRNGEELNPSGTSGTFEDIIYDVFELDKAYLGLLSLGNTVDNFVKYTGTTRKQLMSKIFTSIGVFSKYYKNASNNAKVCKSVLSNVTSKLDKYKGFNKEEALDTAIAKGEELDRIELEIKNLSVQMGSLSQKIQSNQQFIEEYNAKRAMLFDTLNSIDMLKRKVSTNKDIPTLTNDMETISKSINDKLINKGAYELNLKSSLDYIQELNADLDNVNSTINKMNSDVDLAELDMLKSSLEARLAEIEVVDDPILDKDALVRASIYLDDLRAMCATFISDVQHPEIIAETALRFVKDDRLIDRSKNKLESLLDTLKRESYLKNANVLIGKDSFVIQPTKCEVTECPYRKFYEDYKALIDMKTGEIDSKISNRQRDVDVAKDIVTIGSITRKLMKYMGRSKDIFSVLPLSIFDPENFITLYMETREVADTDQLSTLIDIAEKQKEKQEILNQLDNVEMKRRNNESLRENFESLKERARVIEDNLNRAKKSAEKYQQSLPSIEENINSLTIVKNKIADTISVLKEIEGKRSVIASLNAEISSMDSKSSEIDELQQSLSSVNARIKLLESNAVKLRDEKNNLDATINMIVALEKEQSTLMEEYVNAELIKNAVSPSKGIPLDRIKKYIQKDLISMVNDLLDMVYHGSLYINSKEVIINETEFTIPYRKRGMKVKDICMASDGEKAIIGIAFSLSLARIVSNKYNILLLDEHDTALDVYSRGKYIDIIDSYRKLINCQQVFNITHNAMFDNYPVNVIMTSDMNISYNTDSILRLYKGGNNYET